ncbi:permease [Actinoplanes sp. SE50]|uniref:ABC transporter permease n=1 Tax=unclassified Actinoplanes TaxID=2626549 RepID=UPI00023EC6D2|nr:MULTISPECIES: ABC transporter permease [unclassified Actinoplanes]AEV87613.1 Macrolide export ATP-binding/permease protein macB [Actinoplanes sp. SE50/110]ATO86016.1 permease [Actinoplanes sp. SE50]SLM03430.1 permease [Actinoplanes sp. SE50/110]
MIRLVLGSLRQHRGAYAGTLLAALLAVALLGGGGLLLFSVLTAKPPADRFAAVPVVVAGAREVSLETVTTKAKKEGKTKVKHKVKTERLTGAAPLPADLAGRVAAVPGVAAVVADAAFPLRAADLPGTPIGHGWSSAGLTPYALRAGRAPAAGQVVLDAGLAAAGRVPVGAELRITTRTGTRTLLVSGIAAPPGRDALPAQGAVFVADSEVAAISGLTGPTAIGVRPAAGLDPSVLRDRITAAVGVPATSGTSPAPASSTAAVPAWALPAAASSTAAVPVGALPAAASSTAAVPSGVLPASAPASGASGGAGAIVVLTGDDRVRADLPGALPDYIAPISIFGFVIGITAFAAIFVLTGTVTLSVRQRLRELALLRTAGATPGQLRRMLGREAIVLALIAGLPGAPLGVVLAHLVAARFRALGAVPAPFVVRVSVPVLLLAILAGTLVTYVAARLAGRRAVRIAPTQALTETATAPTGGRAVRVLAAVVTTAGAVAVLSFVPLDGPFGMGMSFISSALLLCAVAALGPILVRPLTALLGRVSGLAGRVSGLAGLISRAEYRRVAAVAVPLVLMFALNATMLLNGRLQDRLAGVQQRERLAGATAQVAVPGGLALPDAERIAARPGVTGAALLLPTRVILAQGGKPEDYAAQGLMTTGADPAIDLGIRAGAPGDGLGASAAVARQYGWRIGEPVDLWLADGYRVTLPLAMTYARNRGFGDLVLPAALIAAHDPKGLVSVISLRGAPGVARGLPTISAATAGGDHADQQGAWELMVVISVGFTAIAVVNTFAIATAGRRGEFAALRLTGATAGQLHRLAAGEAVVTVLTGLLLGATVSGIVVGAFSLAQDGALRVIVDPVTYAGMAAGVAALGLAAGVLPARLLLRRRAPAI